MQLPDDKGRVASPDNLADEHLLPRNISQDGQLDFKLLQFAASYIMRTNNSDAPFDTFSNLVYNIHTTADRREI